MSFIHGFLIFVVWSLLMKSHQAYKELPVKVSQQIFMILDKNWKSFFEAVKAYKNEPTRFTGRPKLAKGEGLNASDVMS